MCTFESMYFNSLVFILWNPRALRNLDLEPLKPNQVPKYSPFLNIIVGDKWQKDSRKVQNGTPFTRSHNHQYQKNFHNRSSLNLFESK